MARPCYSALGNYAKDGKPAIVFVPTRKHARMTALDLLTHAAADGAPYKFRQVWYRAAVRSAVPVMKGCFVARHVRHLLVSCICTLYGMLGMLCAALTPSLAAASFRPLPSPPS